VRSPAAVDVQRDRPDACPGALTVHAAADGGLARIRIPGGFVSGAQLRVIADAAERFGTGVVELTSRGNVQVRGLGAGDVQPLGEMLAGAGLLPSPTHERARNVVASPLAGVDNDVDLSALVADLDRGLCSRPGLARLPGRFLFAVDDGRGDVAALGADVTAVVDGRATRVEGTVADDPVAVLLAVAEAFLAERAETASQAWRVDELGRDAVLARAGHRPAPPTASVAPAPVGTVRQPDGRHALAALAPLGRLDAAQVRAVADVAATRGARVTPWRSIVLPDLADVADATRRLAAIGLGVDSRSRWFGVSACTGRPGCAKALADVQADASAAAQRWPGSVVHWSGCERRCGRPRDAAVDVVATPAGYVVTEA
jgi:precorrin-3B synthase